MPIFSEHIDARLGLVLAYVALFVLFLLETVSFSLPVAGRFDLPFLLISFYYWSIYRPTLIPVWVIFLFGIAADLLNFTPLGLNAFVFLILRALVTDQRLFFLNQSFFTVWVGYTIISALILTLKWFGFGLIVFDWSPYYLTFNSFMAGVFLFPPMVLILHVIHRLLPFVPDHYAAVKS